MGGSLVLCIVVTYLPPIFKFTRVNDKDVQEHCEEVSSLICLCSSDLLALHLTAQEVASLFGQISRSSFFVLHGLEFQRRQPRTIEQSRPCQK